MKQLFILLYVCYVGITLEAKTISWACTDYPSAYYIKQNGSPAGYLYEIAIEVLEKELGLEVKIDFFPWKRCQKLVEEGKYDLMFTIPTEERLKYSVTHSVPAWVKKRVFYTYKNNPHLEKINKFRSIKDVENSNLILISYLGNGWINSKTAGNKGYKVELSPKIENTWNMLAHKRGDLIIDEPGLADANIKRFKLQDKIIRSKGVGSESNFHLIISNKSEFSTIGAAIDEALLKMQSDGRLKLILKKYNQDY